MDLTALGVVALLVALVALAVGAAGGVIAGRSRAERGALAAEVQRLREQIAELETRGAADARLPGRPEPGGGPHAPGGAGRGRPAGGPGRGAGRAGRRPRRRRPCAPMAWTPGSGSWKGACATWPRSHPPSPPAGAPGAWTTCAPCCGPRRVGEAAADGRASRRAKLRPAPRGRRASRRDRAGAAEAALGPEAHRRRRRRRARRARRRSSGCRAGTAPCCWPGRWTS